MERIAEWMALLRDGPEALSDEEQDALVLWVISVLSARRGELTPESIEKAEHLRRFASLLIARDLAEMAAPMARMALDAQIRRAGDDAGTAALVTLAHALLLCVARDEAMPDEEAEALAARVRKLAPPTNGIPTPLLLALYHYGEMMLGAKRYADAEATYALLKRAMVSSGRHAADRELIARRLAVAISSQKREEEAVPLFQEALALLRELAPREPASEWDCATGLGIALWNLGRWTEAETALSEAATLARKAFAPDAEEIVTSDRRLERFRGARVFAETEGRLFGWALKRSTEKVNCCERATEMLLMVADIAPDPDDADTMIAHAARLGIRMGLVMEALHLVEVRLTATRDCWDGAPVIADAVAWALARDQQLARALLAYGLTMTTKATVLEGGRDAALSQLLDELEAIDQPGLVTLAKDLLPVERHRAVLEREVERGIERRDMAILRASLPDYATSGEIEPWTLRDAAWVAAHLGAPELAMVAVDRLRTTEDAHLATAALIELGLVTEAEALAVSCPPGWRRGSVYAALAAWAGVAGSRLDFDRFSTRALEENIMDGVLGTAPLAEGALALMGRASAEEWGRIRMPAKALASYLRCLDPPQPEEPDATTARIDESVAIGAWDEALEAFRAMEGPRDVLMADKASGTLRRVGDGYVIARSTIRFAEHAARERPDIALQALGIALARLPGGFPDSEARLFQREQLRYTAARDLGNAARRLLAQADRDRFADMAFAAAADLVDMPAAVSLVIAAGYATAPAPLPYGNDPQISPT